MATCLTQFIHPIQSNVVNDQWMDRGQLAYCICCSKKTILTLSLTRSMHVQHEQQTTPLLYGNWSIHFIFWINWMSETNIEHEYIHLCFVFCLFRFRRMNNNDSLLWSINPSILTITQRQTNKQRERVQKPPACMKNPHSKCQYGLDDVDWLVVQVDTKQYSIFGLKQKKHHHYQPEQKTIKHLVKWPAMKMIKKP